MGKSQGLSASPSPCLRAPASIPAVQEFRHKGALPLADEDPAANVPKVSPAQLSPSRRLEIFDAPGSPRPYQSSSICCARRAVAACCSCFA